MLLTRHVSPSPALTLILPCCDLLFLDSGVSNLRKSLSGCKFGTSGRLTVGISCLLFRLVGRVHQLRSGGVHSFHDVAIRQT